MPFVNQFSPSHIYCDGNPSMQTVITIVNLMVKHMRICDNAANVIKFR